MTDAERPDAVAAEYHDTGQPVSSFMYRRGPWKLIEYSGGYSPQLFHLEEDPAGFTSPALYPFS